MSRKKHAENSSVTATETITRRESPEMAVLELTHACPAYCPGCPKEVRSGPLREMGVSDWDRIIKDLSCHVRSLRLSGGEPVNYRYFAEIVGILERVKVPFTLLTAGLWKEPERVFAVLKRSTALRGISFSLHGERQTGHDTFLDYRGFDEAVNNIRHCAAEGLLIQTASVLGEHNRQFIRETLRFAFQLGSRSHIFHRYLGPHKQGIGMLREDLAILLDFIGKISREGFPVYLDGCFPRCFSAGEFHCLAGITWMSIDPCGNVKPCPFSHTITGNLRDRLVQEVWSGREFSGWVESFPGECSRCRALRQCRGGCRALRERFGIKRDPLMESPL